MLAAPEPLASHHEPAGFDSGVHSLDDWLKRRTPQNQSSGASRTFVCRDANRVVAYHALASSAVAPWAAPGRFRPNMPDPIPVVVLARLAIAKDHQKQGLGRALFQDAAKRVIHAADGIGIRGLLVHAISPEAKDFYLRLGLGESPLDPLTLISTINDLRASLGD